MTDLEVVGVGELELSGVTAKANRAQGGRGKLVEDQVEKLTIGDRISQGTLTATVHTVGPEFIGIRWEGKEWSAIYARTEMGRGFNDYGCARVSSGGFALR